MKKNIFTIVLSVLFVQAAVAQPSLKAMKKLLQTTKEAQAISNFELSDKMPFLGSLRFADGRAPAKEQAISWLREKLQLRTGADGLFLIKEENNKNNIQIQTISQSYNGIKVEHGKINIASKNGIISFMQMEFYTLPDDIAKSAAITENVAFQKALAFTNAEKYAWDGYTGNNPEYQRPVGELVYVQDIFKNIGQMCLAYKFLIAADQPFSKAYVYINATTGDVVFTDQIIKHANATGTGDTRYSGTQTITTDNVNDTTYRLRELRNGDSIITVNYQKRIRSTANDLAAVDFTDKDNNWTSAEFNNANYDDAALDVQYGLQEVSDYWNLVHARAGWNNAHAPMKSYVHVRAAATADYDNAFWGGTAMYYGDGTYLSGNANGFRPLTALDVTAHELGHAVCQSTAGLVYQRESGGLNEGFSDIWGAAVEHYSGLGGFKQNFKIGEEISPNQSTGFLRDMQNPNLGTQPDTYLGLYWYPTSLGGCPGPNSNTNDNCGVHYNSGLINKWFFLIVQGENGTNDKGDIYSVSPIGWTKAEQIAYLTEQNLTANSDYAATRTATINAATILYGACSNEVVQVTNAWFAVGVGTTANCTPRVEFVNGSSTVSEGNGIMPNCATKVFNVPVKLGSAATAPVTLTFTPSGTAINNFHYVISPSALTFNTGETGSKNLAVTILDNAAIDGNKTIVLNYTVNANSGNGAAGVNNQSHIITITDDDVTPSSVIATPAAANTSVLSENFETNINALPTGWASLSFTGGASTVNYWTVGSNGGAGINGQAAYITNDTNVAARPLAYNATSPTDKILRSRVFSTAGLLNLKLSLKYKIEGEYYLTPPISAWDFGRIMYSTNGTQYTFLNDPATNAPYILYGTGNVATTLASVVLPAALANQPTVYIGFRFTSDNSTGANPSFLVDDISITGQPSTVTAETAANQSVSSNLIAGSYSSYLYSSADSQLVARITALNQNVGCLTAGLSASGNGQRTITTPTANIMATQKVIQLSPAIPNSSPSYTGTLYFTAAELAVWGANKTNLKILKVKEGVSLTSTLNLTNAEIVTPTSVVDNTATTGIIAYTGNFTGFSQFMLADPAISLPITLSYFKIALQNKDAVLTWETEQEINNKGFEILRSLDGVNFTSIGFVNGRVNSSTHNSYAFTDPNIVPNTTIYYRLRQVDTDGKFTLSKILSVRFKEGKSYISSIWPNPASAEVNISFSTSIKAGTITVIDQQGRKLITKTINTPTVKTTLRLSGLAAGTYLVQINSGENIETQKLIVRRD